MHALYRDGSPKSIKQAIDEANNDNLEWYLPLTDSIIGMIKCHDLNRVENGDKESLKKVGLGYYLDYNYIKIIIIILFVTHTMSCMFTSNPSDHVTFCRQESF